MREVVIPKGFNRFSLEIPCENTQVLQFRPDGWYMGPPAANCTRGWHHLRRIKAHNLNHIFGKPADLKHIQSIEALPDHKSLHIVASKLNRILALPRKPKLKCQTLIIDCEGKPKSNEFWHPLNILLNYSSVNEVKLLNTAGHVHLRVKGQKLSVLGQATKITLSPGSQVKHLFCSIPLGHNSIKIEHQATVGRLEIAPFEAFSFNVQGAGFTRRLSVAGQVNNVYIQQRHLEKLTDQLLPHGTIRTWSVTP